MTRTARLRIRRGTEGEPARYDLYEVPFEEGASALDGVLWIRANRDAGVAIRYSCISANVCKECTILVDGVPAYACTTRLRDDAVMTLDPLPGKRLLRDLVTDTLPTREKLG